MTHHTHPDPAHPVVEHVGGKVNAEDCPACASSPTTLPYPWICPGSPAPEPCAYETRRATFVDPPEFCDEEAVPGSDYCKGHDPDAYEDYLIERAESRREMEADQ